MEVLGDVGMAVATDATNSLLARTKKHIRYLYKYKENLNSLQAVEEKLDAKRTDASRFAQDAHRKLKDVSSTATLWKREADELYRDAQKMISASNISRLHPWSRYSASKHAWELAEEIKKKVQTAPDFGTTFDHPQQKLGAKFDLTGFTEFESRALVVNQVWEALKDDKVRICSICGMGGTGKTTLAKKLIQGVESDQLFDKVGMATVSQNPDLRKIRGDIMSSLGRNFNNEEKDTSYSLYNYLMESDGRTLLILDDVWEVLDLEEIGIPRARVKILLTSRKEDVCQIMKSQVNCVINVLTDEEARRLFKEIAMESIEKLKLHDTARKIADECGGLPIIIVTLATALKYEVKATWKDSLQKLENSNLLGISGMEKVYSRIQLSYDLLNDHEAQACFRLCCLFPEDFNVSVECLVFYAKGLQLFTKVESLMAIRYRVGAIINKLKKSFLLLDGEEDGCVKMHDIIRDFAISISSKGNHPYVLGCEHVMEKWLERGQHENCNAISFMCDQINERLVDLRCPKIQLLHLISNGDPVELPKDIFDGLKELKVLVLEVPTTLQSLPMLMKLRTLIIKEMLVGWVENETTTMGDVLVHIGDLENLEILEFASGRPRNDFPVEIGHLYNLRFLRFSDVEFNYMPPGVLSRLVKLEELELPLVFNSWGSKEEGGERVNASLDEIECLPLSALKINLGYGSTSFEKLIESLTRFHVCVGNTWNSYTDLNGVLEVVDLDARDHVAKSSMSCLLTKCESLNLVLVKNLKNIMCLQSDQDNRFPQLKDIHIYDCNEMEYLVDTTVELKTLNLSRMDSLKEIWHCPKIEPTWPCFRNLSDIQIDDCPKLKHLFPLSVAIELRQLQRIFILNCKEVEEIFYRHQEDDENQQVASLSVHSTTPIVETTTTLLKSSVTSSSNIDQNPQAACPKPNSFIRRLLGRSEKHPKRVSTPQILEEDLAKVYEKEVHHSVIFPQLKTLDLKCLRQLRIVYDGNQAIELPSLETLCIWKCNNIEALSYGSFKAPRLKEIGMNHTDYQTTGEDLNEFVKKTAVYTGSDSEEAEMDHVEEDDDNYDNLNDVEEDAEKNDNDDDDDDDDEIPHVINQLS